MCGAEPSNLGGKGLVGRLQTITFLHHTEQCLPQSESQWQDVFIVERGKEACESTQCMGQVGIDEPWPWEGAAIEDRGKPCTVQEIVFHKGFGAVID